MIYTALQNRANYKTLQMNAQERFRSKRKLPQQNEMRLKRTRCTKIRGLLFSAHDIKRSSRIAQPDVITDLRTVQRRHWGANGGSLRSNSPSQPLPDSILLSKSDEKCAGASKAKSVNSELLLTIKLYTC